MAYDRYSKFRKDNGIKTVPFIPIRERSTDQYTVFRKNMDRLDLLSYKYYGDSSYGWLILQANPTVPSLEFQIPDKTLLRIPFPLNDALIGYEEDTDEYLKQYPLD
jgi:phage tail protein X